MSSTVRPALPLDRVASRVLFRSAFSCIGVVSFPILSTETRELRLREHIYIYRHKFETKIAYANNWDYNVLNISLKVDIIEPRYHIYYHAIVMCYD